MNDGYVPENPPGATITFQLRWGRIRPNHETHQQELAMKRPARWTYYGIFGVPLMVMGTMMLLAPSATTASQRPSEFVFIVVMAFLGWLFLGRRIALLLLPLFITSLKCPGCQEEISPVGVWNCACGYHDHRERHILAGTCPKCGVRTGHIDCPRCSCTLLLW
jgi:hypothetical protein